MKVVNQSNLEEDKKGNRHFTNERSYDWEKIVKMKSKGSRSFVTSTK